MRKKKKSNIGRELIEGMENAVAQARGGKPAARKTVVDVATKAERALTRAASATSKQAFAAVWNNPDDDVYNER